MTLKQRGQYWYGDDQGDIRDEILRYSKLQGYLASQFADARCSCGATAFMLLLDDREGAAVRHCTNCEVEHPIGDSDEFLEEANLEGCVCPCEMEEFEITVGVSLYEDSDDVRWLYLACRCTSCRLTAVYGDWKNEFLDYKKLLANV